MDILNWRMVAHINTGPEKKHKWLYNAEYKGHCCSFKTGEKSEFSVMGFSETFDNENDLIEFLKDKESAKPKEDSKEMKEQKEFFKKLEDMRLKSKMTLIDFSKVFNMSPAHYCKYRGGLKLLSDEDFAMLWVWFLKEQKRLESEEK